MLDSFPGRWCVLKVSAKGVRRGHGDPDGTIEILELRPVDVAFGKRFVEAVKQLRERRPRDCHESREVGVTITREPFGKIPACGCCRPICLTAESKVAFDARVGAQLNYASADSISLLPCPEIAMGCDAHHQAHCTYRSARTAS